jgi:hypothetical protein
MDLMEDVIGKLAASRTPADLIIERVFDHAQAVAILQFHDELRLADIELWHLGENLAEEDANDHYAAVLRSASDRVEGLDKMTAGKLRLVNLDYEDAPETAEPDQSAGELIQATISQDREAELQAFLDRADLEGMPWAKTRKADLVPLLNQAVDLLRRLNHAPVTPAVTGRLCACGCGQPITSARPEAKYASGACRVRAHRTR